MVAQHSYTDINTANFHCGKNEPQCKFSTDVSCTESNAEHEAISLASLDGCQAILLNDKWAVTPAYCADSDGLLLFDEIARVRVGTAFEEILEFKRVFLHPHYIFSKIYNDVAVLELARRVEYDYKKFGDTPTCIDRGLYVKENKTAAFQIYDFFKETTESVNVTVISNKRCAEILNKNITNNEPVHVKIREAIPFGLNYGLMCTSEEEDSISREPIPFDPSIYGSGSPLTQQDTEGRKTLIGFAPSAEGLEYDKSYPQFFTKIEFNLDWIQCIMEMLPRLGHNKEAAEKECSAEVVEEPKCCQLEGVHDIFNTDRKIQRDICKAYKTGKLQGDKEKNRKLDDILFG